jgi:hypothetical protein
MSAYEDVWRWSGGDWRIGRVRKNLETRRMEQPARLHTERIHTGRNEYGSQAV